MQSSAVQCSVVQVGAVRLTLKAGVAVGEQSTATSMRPAPGRSGRGEPISAWEEEKEEERVKEG